MMGHSKIITTQIYARVLDKKVELDMEKLNKKLFK
jgi:site-specific recombinase XerD